MPPDPSGPWVGCAGAAMTARMRPTASRATMPAMTRDVARPTEDQPHVAHGAHQHRHDLWCGHAQVEHDDHLDYLHDGHLHHPDRDHVDDRPATQHLPHGGHMHVHSRDCGHEMTVHAGHADFRHGQHLHAVHGDHYDEH